LSARLLGVAISLVLALAVAGCSGDEDTSSEGSKGSRVTRGADSLPRGLERSTIEVGQVAGTLSRRDRRRLVADVGGLVDRWFERAWLSAPLGKKVNPFPGFTPAAERRARKDRRVTTVRAVDRPLGGVVPRTRGIRLDVLAPGGTPHAVTARFHLGLAAYDTRMKRLDGRVVVTGRLMLAKVGRRWMVFGYDVATSTRGETGTQSGKATRTGKAQTRKRAGTKAGTSKKAGETRGRQRDRKGDRR
jgi:hypothetical protein